ncbi:hypothetical protein, partial [Actinoallomurus acaciae]
WADRYGWAPLRQASIVRHTPGPLPDPSYATACRECTAPDPGGGYRPVEVPGIFRTRGGSVRMGS